MIISYKIFLDANVLLDFFLKREKYEHSKKLITLLIERRLKGFISPSILHILAYWLSKAYGRPKAKQLLQTLLMSVVVIDCSHKVAEAALHSQIDDIEDALQYYTALNHEIEYFISGDKELKKWTSPSLPVYNLEEFLKKAEGF